MGGTRKEENTKEGRERSIDVSIMFVGGRSHGNQEDETDDRIITSRV